MPACDVEVNAVFLKGVVPVYNITFTPNENGCGSSNYERAIEGTEIELEITPNGKYTFSHYTINGEDEVYTDLSFPMPSEDIEITMFFDEPVSYTITKNDSEYGIIALTKVKAYEGDTINLNAVAATNYTFIYFTVNGKRIEGRSFTMPASNVVVTAVFRSNSSPEYTITIEENAGGIITASKSKSQQYEIITVAQEDNPGYDLVKIEVNGSVLEGDSFEMPASNVTIKATYTHLLYNITLDEDIENGVIYALDFEYYYGEEVGIIAEPNSNAYMFEYLLVDNEIVYAKTFKMPEHDVYVSAAFCEFAYLVTVDEMVNGTVTSNIRKGKAGDIITLTINPDSGYELSSLMVNNVSILGETTYEIGEEDVHITAEFSKKTYNITTLESAHITINVIKTALFEKEIEVSFTVEKGYFADYFTVNGERYELEGRDTTYGSFVMPASDVEIKCYAGEDTYEFSIELYESNLEIPFVYYINDVLSTDTIAKYGDIITIKLVNTYPYEMDYAYSYRISNPSNIYATYYSEDELHQSVDVKMLNRESLKFVIYTALRQVPVTITADSKGNAFYNQRGTTSFNVVLGQRVGIIVIPNEGYLPSHIIATNTITNETRRVELTEIYPGEEIKYVFAYTSDGYPAELTVYYEQFFNITSSINNGTITGLPSTAIVGEEVTFDYVLDENYSIVQILLNDVEISGKSFTMPSEDVALEIETALTYDITITEAQNGSISAPNTAAAGSLVTVTPSPASGYYFAYLIIDGKMVFSRSFTMPEKDVSISCFFDKSEVTSITEAISSGEQASFVGTVVAVTNAILVTDGTNYIKILDETGRAITTYEDGTEAVIGDKLYVSGIMGEFVYYFYADIVRFYERDAEYVEPVATLATSIGGENSEQGFGYYYCLGYYEYDTEDRLRVSFTAKYLNPFYKEGVNDNYPSNRYNTYFVFTFYYIYCRPLYGPTVEIVDMSPLTVEQLENVPDSSYAYFSGTVKSFGSGGTTYGNFYIEDENGEEYYVYGLSDANGVRYDSMTSNKPVLGDKITLYGQKVYYDGGGFYELKYSVLISKETSE